MNWLQGRGLAAAIVALACAGTVWAQESSNRVAANSNWSVFVEAEPKECWSVSAPKETVNTKDGQVVAVRRSDILLFVSYRPASGIKGEVSFTGGYPFADGSTVSLVVEGTSFDLFTEGEWGWSASPEEDAKIIAALRAGGSAVLTARSARGTQTQDTFALDGFSAALDEAASRCAG